MSLPNFDCGPYVQAFQPQLNDKNTRRIDKATHQIIQRALPDSVKVRYDAAHTSGVVLPVSDCLDGFLFVIKTEIIGDVAQQKKTFASLSSKQRTLPIRAITAAEDDIDNDVDLIDLHDPEDQDSDADQDFP